MEERKTWKGEYDDHTFEFMNTYTIFLGELFLYAIAELSLWFRYVDLCHEVRWDIWGKTNLNIIDVIKKWLKKEKRLIFI